MGTTVTNGETEYVYKGGSYGTPTSLDDVEVNGGGILDVGYGGTVESVTAIGGGSNSLATISAHGDGGTSLVEDYTIGNYAFAYASNGATLTNGTISGGAAIIGSGGSIVNTNIDGSGTLANTDTANKTQDYVNVLAGGYASGITTEGGSLNVSSGASVDSSHASAGYINVNADASGTGNSVVGAQAQLNVLGGSVTSTTVSAGQFNVQDGGTAKVVTVSGGVMKDMGGTVVSATILGSGSANVISGGVLSASTVENGGVIDVDSASTLVGTTTVSNGGQLILNGSAGSGDIILAGSNSLLTINGDTMPTNVISGLENGGKIDLVDLKSYTNVATTSSGIDFTGVDENGNSVDFHLNIPDANTIGWQLVSDGSGGLYYEIGSNTNNDGSTTGPVTSGITVTNGETAYVYNNGSGSEPNPKSSYFGQSVDNAQVNGGGTLNVGYDGTVDHVAAIGSAGSYGGSASYATISAHGDNSSAIVKDYTISNYALAYASNGGEFINGSVNGGTVEVGSGGLIGDSNIYGSGNYTNTATANQTEDYVNVLSGGTASGITTMGGSLNVQSGGFVESSHASSGYINVSGGASGTGNTVFEGGQLNALGGTITDSIMSGGELWVSSGGTANGVTDGSGIDANGSAVAGRAYVSGGTLENATVNGGTVFVGQDGVFENSVISGSGTLANTDTANKTQDYANISAGGYASGITTEGGSLNVLKGASVDSSTASAGYINVNADASGTGNSVVGAQAQLNVLGGSVTSTTVSAGQFNVQDGGTATVVTVSGGVMKDMGGTVVSATILGSGSANVISGGVLSASTVENGGVIDVDSASTLVGTTTVSNGGQLILNGSAGSGDIILAGSNSLLTISGDTMPTNVISGLENGGKIDLVDLKTVTTVTTTSSGIDFSGMDENGKSVDFHLNIPDADTIGEKLVSDGNGGFYYEVCFLSGSMIRTLDGDVAVEDIQIGDQLVAFDWQNNKNIMRPVVWVGKAHTTIRPDLPDDEAGYPVRILKDAIADGMPYKDMLITAEHCLFFEGKFVPVRMLVNGSSIFYDKSITSYDYYHVETEQHSVITADGTLTESYLDTGNRRTFRQEGTVVSLRDAAQNWEKDAGAPLCVDRAFVEPLFHALKLRCNTVADAQKPVESAELVMNPDLHLVTENGAIIRPIRHDGPCYSFMLPANIASVRIVSRASRAADVIGPFVDDRRMMGVAVADVYFVTAKHQEAVTPHLQSEKPAGWHDTDWTDCAWTNGDAVLPLGNLTQDCMGILSLNIRAAGPYQKQDTKVILNSKYSA